MLGGYSPGEYEDGKNGNRIKRDGMEVRGVMTKGSWQTPADVSKRAPSRGGESRAPKSRGPGQLR